MASAPARRDRARLESSVRHLQALYIIVAGLALSDAIASLLGGGNQGWRNPVALALLTAFVVTLVPFFHGALRHFDDTYLIPDGELNIGRASLAVDFGFLFVESGILFALARQVRDPFDFGVSLAVLLLVDIIWVFAISGAERTGLAFHQEIRAFVAPNRQSKVAQQAWARNNMMFMMAFIALILSSAFLWPGHELGLAIGVLGLSVARTLRDYQKSWDFYFPPQAIPAEGD